MGECEYAGVALRAVLDGAKGRPGRARKDVEGREEGISRVR